MDIEPYTMTALESKPGFFGLNEIHVEVQWSDNDQGRRFFHVKHDSNPPCVSELIEADALQAISDGRQKMTGHVTLKGDFITLEVWSDVAASVEDWSLEVIPAKTRRELYGGQ